MNGGDLAKMDNQTLVFKPRPSTGWLWVGGLGLFIGGIGLFPVLLGPVPLLAVLPSLLICGGLGLAALALAAWFPTMRYELDGETLTLRYGPILRYRIPLEQIKGMRRRNLSISLWSSMRLPGLALFTVPYSDVGRVKMCATAAATRILLIETDGGLYGVTPAEEERFVAAVQERLGS